MGDDAVLGVDEFGFDGVENPLGVRSGVVVVGVGVVGQQGVGRERVAAGEDRSSVRGPGWSARSSALLL